MQKTSESLSLSPNARAMAKKMEPIMPVRANGTTARHVASHFVAPLAKS